MLNKILIFGGIGLGAILVVENMVISGGTAFIFLYHGKAGTLVLISLLIGGIIGFGIKGTISDKNKYEDDDRMDF